MLYEALGTPAHHSLFKFRGNLTAVSGEKIFEQFLPYMGMAAILVM